MNPCYSHLRRNHHKSSRSLYPGLHDRSPYDLLTEKRDSAPGLLDLGELLRAPLDVQPLEAARRKPKQGFERPWENIPPRGLGRGVERGPTSFKRLLQIPVHHHSDIYSPILPHEEGYVIQAFSRYLCLVQQVMSPASSFAALKLLPRPLNA